ncbi:putative ecdysone oxidase [Operophtera brumata]|uniref:Putative ecdysone oxidase n=1 Tax=Operophtera brumata TaxID=104452 RepID=A0A0L7KZE8_OPEBR|nr:putative ecdysone oxidase [Operophtera brumata]
MFLDKMSFDYIIVGGGTAGCVLANRLTEIHNTTVLLIEAGAEPTKDKAYLGTFALHDPHGEQDWNYIAENDGYASQAVKDQAISLIAGKILGGSSQNSYMAYTRGAPGDYDKWESLGNEGWGWKDVLKYFKKSESIDDLEAKPLVCNTGPTNVKMPKWEDRLDVLLKGFEEYGYKTLYDINGYERQGYGTAQFAIDDHYRQDTVHTYLNQIRNRTNFSLQKYTEVVKILINKKKVVTGVEAIVNGKEPITFYARKEVIVSAGAINSPKLLMLSGIGPKQHLKENGIKMKVDSRNVGENLSDTPMVMVPLTGKEGFESFKNNADLILNLNIFPTPVAIGHISVNPTQNSSDYQSHVLPVPSASVIPAIFCSTIFRLDNTICISLAAAGIDKEIIINPLALLHPESKGNVKLNSKNPTGPPIVSLNYFDYNTDDLERHATYIEDYLNVIKTKTFKSFKSQILKLDVKECRHLEFATHEYWKCYALNLATSMWNYSGTCAMGTVVSPRLEVKGVKHLRVADASVMPRPVSGNIGAAVVMIAEKASDMIKDKLHHTEPVYGYSQAAWRYKEMATLAMPCYTWKKTIVVTPNTDRLIRYGWYNA